MFERYTERAQTAVLNAQQQARDLGFGYVGTEHLLLGLLNDPESPAVTLLKEMGRNAGIIRDGLLMLIGRGTTVVTGQLDYTPRARKVLSELAAAEAQELGVSYVGAEHLLLGLLREGEGHAAVALDRAGVCLDGARAAARHMAGEVEVNRMDPIDYCLKQATAVEFERAVRLVRRAAHEAEQLGAAEVHLEHFLLALLADPEAADLVDLLNVRGVTLEWLRGHFRFRGA